MRPAVSVVMSVYNGALYLSRALDSVKEQTYADYEFIIVDDGSSDTTWQILKDYESRDHRIILIRNDCNIGLPRSLNKGLLRAQGDYIARQDCDDISLPDRIEKQVGYLDRNSDVIMVSCNMFRIDAAGRLLRKIRTDCESELIPWYLLFSNRIQGHSQVMFRRKAAVQLGGYSEKFKYSQDYEFWVRLSKHGKIAILPDFLLQYRWHQNRVSHNASEEQIKCAINVSASYLSELTGEKIDSGEAYRLWSFWMIEPTQSAIFQSYENLKKIHIRLKKIRKRYFAVKLINLHAKDRIFRKINDSIGKRYLKWALFQIYSKASPKAVFCALAYSVCWLRIRFFNVFFKLLLSLAVDRWISSSSLKR